MKVIIESPIQALIGNLSEQEMDLLKSLLTYTNTANQHKVKRHYNNHFWRNKNTETWEAELNKLKASVKNTLIFEENGLKFIRPGSIPYLDSVAPQVSNLVKYPEPKKVAWAKPLSFELHEYQEESWKKLVEVKHGNVELCTGAGKSAILLKICRETGFRAAIIAPSKSIFNELVEKFEYHLGRVNVGKFGDGKKTLGKRFTICIGDSVANIKPGSKEWEFFSGLDMLCVDESHTWGAETLEDICHGVLANVPYRFFFSGTQTRGDGAERLLQSIIGKTVHTLTTSEAAKAGYICDHEFRVVTVESSNPYFNSSDVLEMKRAHLLNNKNIASFIAKLANADATINRRQTLVLVDELPQIAMLSKLLTVPFAYAHSESKPDRLAELGLTKVDPAESVDMFNRAEVMVLIGTSCISTGTNIYPTHNTANWQGGSSEIKTKQGTVGRSVRKHDQNPYKDKCLRKEKAIIWDFDVCDIYVLTKHLEDRISCYQDSGTEIKRINLNAKTQTTGGLRR
jgi:superfamily II DNA or RNA helicase